MEENICTKNDPRRGKFRGSSSKIKGENQTCSSSDDVIITSLYFIANFCTKIITNKNIQK